MSIKNEKYPLKTPGIVFFSSTHTHTWNKAWIIIQQNDQQLWGYNILTELYLTEISKINELGMMKTNTKKIQYKEIILHI